MPDELQALEDAVRDFKRDADLDFVDPKRLAAVIDGLQGTLSTVLFQGKRRGDHLLAGDAREVAVEALSQQAGTADGRTPKQRRADALVEVVNRAMDKGTLPRRNGVRPHISVSTTIEGLKGELGAAASQLGNGMPISSKTVQRLACDGTLHRILKADSAVVDVGWATRSVSPSQWRALKARHRTCSGPGCDRPVSMTSPHHIEFWARGGRSDLPNLVPLWGLLPKGSYEASGVGFAV